MPKMSPVEQAEMELKRNPLVLARLIAIAERRGARFRYPLGLLMVESLSAPYLSRVSRRALDDIWMELSVDLRREAEMKARQRGASPDAE